MPGGATAAFPVIPGLNRVGGRSMGGNLERVAAEGGVPRPARGACGCAGAATGADTVRRTVRAAAGVVAAPKLLPRRRNRAADEEDGKEVGVAVVRPRADEIGGLGGTGAAVGVTPYAFRRDAIGGGGTEVTAAAGIAADWVWVAAAVVVVTGVVRAVDVAAVASAGTAPRTDTALLGAEDDENRLDEGRRCIVYCVLSLAAVVGRGRHTVGVAAPLLSRGDGRPCPHVMLARYNSIFVFRNGASKTTRAIQRADPSTGRRWKRTLLCASAS